MALPPIVLPPELGITVEDIFHPVDPSLVPEIADVLAWLAEHDPETLAAVADVDRTLIWSAMNEMTPFEHVRAGAQMIEDLSTFAERAQVIQKTAV